MTSTLVSEVSPSSPTTRVIPEAGEVLLGKYRVERTIGAGGMATVLAATHLKLDERVAIKLPRPDLVNSPSAVERFLQEARVSSRLRGEHVVRVFDVGTLENGSPYIVMEYLAGADLRTLLARRGPFPFAVAVDYVLQTCEAVAEAHANGIVHRDLKPANLFLTRRVDGSACIKVLDFGISKMLDASRFSSALDETAPSTGRFRSAEVVRAGPTPVHDTSFTKTRAIMGSPRYMAPEQVRSARDVDQRTDIWALGILLYELMEGAPPFMDDDLEALREAILTRPVPALTLSKAPEKLEAIMRRCLERDPARRFEDVHAFAEALATFGSQNARAVGARIGRVLRGSDVGDGEHVHGSTGGQFVSVAPEPKASSGFTPSRAAVAMFVVGALVGVGFGVAREGRVPSRAIVAPEAAASPLVSAAPPPMPPRVEPPAIEAEARAVAAVASAASVASAARPLPPKAHPRPAPRVKAPAEAVQAKALEPAPARPADPFADPE